MNKMAEAIHNIALKYGCDFKPEIKEGSVTTNYTLRNFTLIEEGETVKFVIKTSFVFLKKLFNETGNYITKQLIFDTLRPCSYCISDKCTTLLMEKARTLELEGRTKKACSMWGQWPFITVTEDNLSACEEIVETVLKDAEGEKHTDLRVNDISYVLNDREGFYTLGYRLRHSEVSPSEEEFIKDCLPKMPGLIKAAGIIDEGTYIGATDNFINGIQYDFIFGLMLVNKPEILPEGAVLRKVRPGKWAVYSSSLNDYPSVWKHFTEQFYKLEECGYDRSRIPFEFYDSEGQWSGLHIPIDPEEPEDAGKVLTIKRQPDCILAGFENMAELDHPEYKSFGFDEMERVKEFIPDWSVALNVNIHQYYGKPLRGVNGVIIDDYMKVPEELERIVLKGGLNKIVSRRHFNGWSQDWDLDSVLDSRQEVFYFQHPRGFNEYHYRARGGYSEISIPIRTRGKITYEEVTLDSCRLFVKLEDPINNKTVPDEELNSYYDHCGNAKPGSLIVAFKMKVHNDIPFFSEPLMKGVYAAEGAKAPEGFDEVSLEGGKFVKISELNPDGTPYLSREPGWEVEEVRGFPSEVHPQQADYARYCRMVQFGNGRYYEYYIPVL